MKDYYYILGLSPDASRAEIRKAYRKLSVKFHPDKNQGELFFEKHFKEIQEAYETLYNEERKEVYDLRYQRKKTYYSYKGEIISFQANKSTLTSGDEITFFWATQNVKYIYLSCYKEPLPPSGKKTLKIYSRDEKELTVILSAKDNQGTTHAQTLHLHLKRPIPTHSTNTPESEKEKGPPFSNREIFLFFASFFVLIFLLIFFSFNSNSSRNIDVTPPSPSPVESRQSFTTTDSRTGEATLLKFVSLLNDENFVEAYSLTANAFWQNFPFFRDSVWGDLNSYEIIQSPEIRHYSSKWGADRIYNFRFSAYDIKNHRIRDMNYDFHMKKVKNEWAIVRMAFPRENDPWYEDDHLYKTKDDPLLQLINRPHALLQRYYDNFHHPDSLLNNRQYYNEILIIHFDDTMISAEKALQKDQIDFEINDVRSYVILVNSYSMITHFYDQFDLVQTPLIYYITQTDGRRVKYNTSITAVLNKENDKILAIGNEFSVDDLIRAVDAQR